MSASGGPKYLYPETISKPKCQKALQFCKRKRKHSGTQAKVSASLHLWKTLGTRIAKTFFPLLCGCALATLMDETDTANVGARVHN